MTNNVAQQRTSKGEGIIGQILSGRNLRHMLVEQQKARKAAGLGPVLPQVSEETALCPPEGNGSAQSC